MQGRIVVGTSSWSDPGFVADWYPKGLPAAERLPFYAQRFEGVELNASFYAIPARETVERWVEATPDGFRFDVKLHRLLSRHAADLASLPADLRDRARTTGRGRVVLTPALELALLERLCEAVAPLSEAGRLSSFLLQLSPAFEPRRHELCELDALIGRLSPHPVAVELRHRAWLREERIEGTLGYLAERGAAFVCVDAPAGRQVTILPPVDAVTCDALAYLRAHGRNAKGYVSGRSVAERFGWRYSDEELVEIRERAERLAAQAREVRVMYNNNRSSDAPVAARRFRELLGQDPGPDPEADADAEPLAAAGERRR